MSLVCIGGTQSVFYLHYTLNGAFENKILFERCLIYLGYISTTQTRTSLFMFAEKVNQTDSELYK